MILDNQTFIVPLKLSKEGALNALRGMATHMPDEYLQAWLTGFIDAEQFEEADIVKKELEGRTSPIECDIECITQQKL